MEEALNDADLHKHESDSRTRGLPAGAEEVVRKKITASEGTCHAHSEADGHSENDEQHQVDWVLLAVEVERAQHWTPKLTRIF